MLTVFLLLFDLPTEYIKISTSIPPFHTERFPFNFIYSLLTKQKRTDREGGDIKGERKRDTCIIALPLVKHSSCRDWNLGACVFYQMHQLLDLPALLPFFLLLFSPFFHVLLFRLRTGNLELP